MEQGWEPGSYMALAGERQREGPLVLETPTAAGRTSERSAGSAAAAAAAVAAADELWGPAAEGSAQPDVKRQAATVEQGPKEGAAAERGGGGSRQPQ